MSSMDDPKLVFFSFIILVCFTDVLYSDAQEQSFSQYYVPQNNIVIIIYVRVGINTLVWLPVFI